MVRDELVVGIVSRVNLLQVLARPTTMIGLKATACCILSKSQSSQPKSLALGDGLPTTVGTPRAFTAFLGNNFVPSGLMCR
jgi:hypothetical protein